MYFENGTLNPSSNTLADDLRQELIGGLTNAIAAGFTKWTITDHDYVNTGVTSSTIEHSDGFSVLLMNSTATNNSRLDLLTYIGTDWNTSTKTLNNVGFNTSNTSFTPNSNGHSGVNYTVPSAMPSLTQTGTQGPTVALALSRLTAATSQSEWAIHVEEDYMFFSFKTASTTKGEWIFIGKYNSLITNPSLTDNEPYIILTSEIKTNGATISGGIAYLKSMVPSVAAVQSGVAFSFRQSSAPAQLSTYDRYSSNPDEANVHNVYLSRGTAPATGANVDLDIQANNTSSTFGFIRGQLPDCFFAWSDNALWGDTVQVNNEVYMYSGGLHYGQYGVNPVRSIALWVRVEI